MVAAAPCIFDFVESLSVDLIILVFSPIASVFFRTSVGFYWSTDMTLGLESCHINWSQNKNLYVQQKIKKHSWQISKSSIILSKQHDPFVFIWNFIEHSISNHFLSYLLILHLSEIMINSNDFHCPIEGRN